ncbi:PKS19 [Symbiodinium microadriaticum]|nr:PKS19 [Symbiodinium microadriaticum]
MPSSASRVVGCCKLATSRFSALLCSFPKQSAIAMTEEAVIIRCEVRYHRGIEQQDTVPEDDDPYDTLLLRMSITMAQSDEDAADELQLHGRWAAMFQTAGPGDMLQLEGVEELSDDQRNGRCFSVSGSAAVVTIYRDGFHYRVDKKSMEDSSLEEENTLRGTLLLLRLSSDMAETEEVAAVDEEPPLLDRADVEWPEDFNVSQRQREAMQMLNCLCEALVARGACVVRRAGVSPRRAEEALENAAKLEDVGWLRKETEQAYLGLENMTRIKELRAPDAPAIADEPDEADGAKPEIEDTKSESSWYDPELYGSESEPEKEEEKKPIVRKKDLPPDFTALKEFDEHVTAVVDLLSYSPEAFGAKSAHSKTGSILRIPHTAEGVSLVGQAGAMDERDRRMSEEFMSWVLSRRLCAFYEVEGQGILELRPKGPEVGLPMRLLLRAGTMVFFRHDQMEYRYLPDHDDCLVLQNWLMDKAEPLQFRQLPKCPGEQGCDRVHVKSMTERFPAGAENCDMSFALFSAGTDTLVEPPITRFDKDLYYSPERDAPMRGLAYIMHGSFVNEDQLIGFDNDFFGIDLEEAQAIAPSQRWVLEVGYEVLWKAGWTKRALRGKRVGTFMGDSGSEWNQIYLRQDQYWRRTQQGSIPWGVEAKGEVAASYRVGF